mmetsp:Transcript_9183/g.40222  ORF Transcript_9183/g.40222 Transcript_9183/m.40222 type:complete len:128 (+) Transcript_9183:534-917(+)
MAVGERIGGTVMAFDLKSLSEEMLLNLTLRPKIDFSKTMELVKPIIAEVQARGDDAVRELTLKFDKVELDQVVVDPKELEEPVLEDTVRKAFDVAYDNIHKFHSAQVSYDKISRRRCVQRLVSSPNL